MKPKLKYLIWLRNLVAVLLGLILIDFLVAKYYDGVVKPQAPTAILCIVSGLLVLHQYVKREQANKT